MYNDHVISLIMPIYKKENTIKTILDALTNTTSVIDEYVFVVDGNFDNTEDIVRNWCNHQIVKYQIILQPDVNEVLCCIAGAEVATGDIFIFVQDDMHFYENNWDKILCEKVMSYSLVGGRLGAEFAITKDAKGADTLKWRSMLGRETISGQVALTVLKYFKLDIRAICSGRRTYVNRGPFAIKSKTYWSLGGFDPIFAPIDLDCMDLSCKHTVKYGQPHVYPIGYDELEGTKKSSKASNQQSRVAVQKNTKIIVARHKKLSC